MSLGLWPINGLLLILGTEPYVGPCIDSTMYVLTMVLALFYSTRAIGMVLDILYSASHPPASTQSGHSTPSFKLGNSPRVISPKSFEGFQDYGFVITKGLLPLITVDHN